VGFVKCCASQSISGLVVCALPASEINFILSLRIFYFWSRHTVIFFSQLFHKLPPAQFFRDEAAGNGNRFACNHSHATTGPGIILCDFQPLYALFEVWFGASQWAMAFFKKFNNRFHFLSPHGTISSSEGVIKPLRPIISTLCFFLLLIKSDPQKPSRPRSMIS